MISISTAELVTVIGGRRGQSSEQVRERYENFCLTPNPDEARLMYDVMTDHMGDGGVWRSTIKAVGELCGWPVPPAAANAKPFT